MQSGEHFTVERINDDESDLLKGIIAITSSERAMEFVKKSFLLLQHCDITNKDSFTTPLLQNFNQMKPGYAIAANDYDVKLHTILRGRKPPVSEFLSCFVVVSPHSMTVERCVSTHNISFSDLRSSTSTETINNRLLIHWNGVNTDNYDHRPAVQPFMTSKNRRLKLPTVSTYKENKEGICTKLAQNHFGFS